MSDRVAVKCDACGAAFTMPAQFLGRRATCRKCGAKFVARPIQGAAPPAATPNLAAELEAALAAGPSVRTGAGAADGVRDDDVMAWLDESDSSTEAPPPPRPRVVTTRDLCGVPDGPAQP